MNGLRIHGVNLEKSLLDQVRRTEFLINAAEIKGADGSDFLIGFRVPFYMISPWTRGNRVFTERADHNSQILLIEQWLAARGYENIQTDEMVHWRREHMSNLVSALDLDHVCLRSP